ncbi:hypothetical protein T4A_8314 [Trichinella pseudospiralis]|uniref:Uncharacterized protein n=1 Tax=Trichinella pseudospiralis TaxID=6337 RepID=A0A0V1ESC5_TRIPS|nr:hypothetical protein T4A_8314 [Trichinella pseudospiralis]
MLNWRSEKKTFTENEEAFKNFDHMLEFDHVRYQMCVPRTSAKSETYMLEFDHVRYQMCVPRTSAKSETSMVENPYVDNGWAERAPKLAPQGQLWYLPFQAVLDGARQIWTLSVVQFCIAVDEWNRYLPSKRPATIPPGEHVSSTTKRFYQKQLKVSGSQGCPNEISWHNKRCRVQPDLEGIVWNENYSKYISEKCPGYRERLVYFMNQSSRRDNTQVLQYENEQRCGLSL